MVGILKVEMKDALELYSELNKEDIVTLVWDKKNLGYVWY